MKKKLTILLGKRVRRIARIRGGGSSLPGLVMEKIQPNFVRETLERLPFGVVVVSGTNGKTTTTKMTVELLESQGLRVFTNKTGSNFVRGVAAALLENVDLEGNLRADIAVLELDEAHAVHFINQVKPRYSLLLNVMRDQLDRFGEIDYTAKLLQKLGKSTSGIVVLNGVDSLLGVKNFSKDFSKVIRFGVSDDLANFFPNDENIHSAKLDEREIENIDYLLKDFSNELMEVQAGEISEKFKLQISGVHNVLNLTASIALVKEIIKSENIDFDSEKFKKAIFEIRPAFGRGEIIEIGEQKVKILLVKNPAGFRSSLNSATLKDAEVMIAINDNYADGRDMSWLWDVDFSVLSEAKVSAITGVRAYDMAVRLFHDDIRFDEKDIHLDIRQSVRDFLNRDGENKKIFATYTAMLEIRKEISKITDVEKIL